jgi:ATP-dependent RNA helicase DeaD
LDHLRFVVLDEADRMLDIGFRPDIEKILRRCPKDRQTLLLSATVPPTIERLATRYMVDPEKLDFSPGDATVETIDQYYFTVDPELKFDLLLRLIQRENPAQTIVFCRTKRRTDQVARRLQKKLTGVDAIHGDLTQNARDRVMQRFRDGKVDVLVATDVVGRGIDVTSISHIVNFDIPTFCDDYVHRVGRTGRMGREGVAYTFVLPDQGAELTRIEIRINRLLKRDEIEGFSAYTAPKPPPEKSSEEEAEKPKVAPLLGKKGRPPRRTRRAL